VLDIARLPWGNHNVVIVGVNDGTKQVSKDAWNDGHNRKGLFGFNTQTATVALAADLLDPTDTKTIVTSETGTTDDLKNIGTTNVIDGDILELYANTGHTITVWHNAGGTGNIFLIGNTNKNLSETKPMILIRIGTNWHEVISPDAIDRTSQATILNKLLSDSTVKFANVSDASKLLLYSLGGMTTGKTVTLAFNNPLDSTITFPNATSQLATLALAEDLTNKGIKISRVLGIPDSAITLSTDSLAATSTAITVQSETGTSDNLDTITGLANQDFVYLYAASGHTITLKHSASPTTNKIVCPDGFDLILHENKPTILQRRGTFWYVIYTPYQYVEIPVAMSDETTALSTTGQKFAMHTTRAMLVRKVKTELNTASSSGLVTVDIKENGVSILSTLITIDVGELTSDTAATPPVISDSNLASDALITFHLTVTGTGAKGLKAWLIGYYVP
jgi:hypothetical protein